MGRGTALLLAALAVALAPAGCGGGDSGPITEKNSVYSVRIPAGYEEVSSLTSAAAQLAVGQAADELGATSDPEVAKAWAKEGESGFATNINVTTEDVPAGMDVAAYREATIQNAPRLGMRVGRSRDATLGGEPAFAVEATGPSEAVKLRFRTVAAVHRGVAYNVTLTADVDQFSDEVPDFEDALATWTWRD
jgi:hypothetical protein